MSWTTLRIAPGLVRNTTRYAASGTWYDASLVRFREGTPEKWAGWVDGYPGFSMSGVCRSLHRHGVLDGTRWVSAGTSKKFYMVRNEFQYDVTPVGSSVVVANPLTTTNGSTQVKVTHASHSHYPGSYVVISGASAVGGVPAVDLNKEHVISGWVDDNNYLITVATTATSDASGGGAAVTLSYLFAAGSDDVVVSTSGWGTGAWGEGVWGGAVGVTSGFDQMGIWSQDNWGEDLVANASGGPIFYWKASTASTKMIDILDIPVNYFGLGTAGADGNAPEEAQFILISHRDRHLLAFGCTAFGVGAPVEPMTIRWCSQEAITNWNEGDTTGTAGFLPLSNGSKFISGIATAKEILAWTDQALYSIQYVGGTFIFVADILERWSDICGMKACCSFNGIVYWMGGGGFYSYSGRTDKLACPIWDYISTRLNRQQMAKVCAGSNQNHNEVIFYYPSNVSGNLENDSYAALDTVQGVWTFGALPRTAWMDLDSLSPVLGASPEALSTARLFEHDQGADDGSTSPPSPLDAFIESGPIELSAEGSYDKGDRMMFVKRLMPDVTFRDITTSSTVPQMNIVLKMMDMPGGGFGESASSQAQRSATIPVEQFTKEAWPRLRGRSLSVRYESNTIGTNWRAGFTRIYARTDGQR